MQVREQWIVRMSRGSVLALLAVLLGLLAAVPATALDSPRGQVALTILGKIGDTNVAGVAAFDLAMLEKLPQTTITTTTKWDPLPVKFSGPLLRDVLKLVRASGRELKAVAANDYEVLIPVEDARRYDMLIALRANDRPIPPRTKGPLFVVYPFDSDRKLAEQVYSDRAIWQLVRIEVQ